MQLIWRALITYLDNKLRAGQSVNIKKLGAFTFDIQTELPRVNVRHITASSRMEDDRAARRHIHKVRPCFVVDPVLKQHLVRYKGKEEISPAGSQKSIFQQGFRVIYANPVPIASACQMGVEIVKQVLEAIYKAIEDLISVHDKDITLQMGFAAVRFYNKSLQVKFADYLSKEVTNEKFETTMKRMTSPVATMWRTNTDKMFQRSALGTMIKKPNAAVTDALAQKTAALKMMSMDMSSSAAFHAQKFTRK